MDTFEDFQQDYTNKEDNEKSSSPPPDPNKSMEQKSKSGVFDLFKANQDSIMNQIKDAEKEASEVLDNLGAQLTT